MASSNYVYDNGKKRHNRVNVWQLNKTVQAGSQHSTVATSDFSPSKRECTASFAE